MHPAIKDRPLPTSTIRSPGVWPCLVLLLLAPILVKAPLLIGALIADPALLYAGLHSHLHAGPLTGYPPYPTIDPNIAFTSHALGRRAALNLFDGQSLWWNHFEGVGVPLAGEVQSAALFPLTWLLILRDGQSYMHIALQVIAGWSTWALLRRIGCTPLAATAAALVFEFNGTFAWLANAVVNPIPFLPLTLLGIEVLWDRVATRRKGGAAWLIIGLAASLYAGFPEVAYLDGLLVLVWALVRAASLPRDLRLAFWVRICVGGLAALALAAPALVPFFDFLPLANTGGHGDGFASAHLSPSYALALLSPYAFGSIFQQAPFADFWGSVGGYAGYVLMALALCGIRGPTHRGLSLALALWTAVCLALTYGMPGVSVLLHIVPGLKLAAFYRYLPPSWEFSMCTLAAFALTDLATAPSARRLRVMTVLVGLACALGAWTMAHAGLHPVGRIPHIAWIVTAAFAAALFAITWQWRPVASRTRVLAGLLAFETVLYFLIPVLSYPSRGTIELGGVHYLQQNLGFQRFATLGPVQPNYGSYFGIASVNHNDLPIPKAWTNYVAAHLDGNAPPILFTGVSRDDPGGPSAADSLVASLEAYRRIGTRYVLAPKDFEGTPGSAGFMQRTRDPDTKLAQVFADDRMRIFEITDPAPYFSAAGCTLSIKDRDTLDARCDKPSTLVRLELAMKGWSARVNGESRRIETTGEIFQSVALPQGESTVRFVFTPPFINWAWLAFTLGLLVLAGDLLRGRSRSAGNRAASGEGATRGMR